MKKKYRPLTLKDSPLVCFVSEHGSGQNREYLVLLSSTLMQEVNLSDNTCRVYESQSPLDEYRAWKNGQMKELGYRQCPFDRYLLAQNTLEARLKEKAPKVPVKVKATHYRNLELSGGTVLV